MILKGRKRLEKQVQYQRQTRNELEEKEVLELVFFFVNSVHQD